MALPANPISGGHELTNSAGISDRWTCPNCYEDHVGSLDGKSVSCSCGATLKLTIEYEPVCRSECIDPDEEDEG
jgi:hypothetical protein